MGILGLTHDERGAALEKLPVTIKVAIGEAPEPRDGNSHPRRLDHFVFKRKTRRLGVSAGHRQRAWGETNRTGNHLPQ